jgi:hypothetical protein
VAETEIVFMEVGNVKTVANPGTVVGVLLSTDAQASSTVSFSLNGVELIKFYQTSLPASLLFIPLRRSVSAGDQMFLSAGGYVSADIHIMVPSADSTP